MEGHGVATALYAMHLSILWSRHFNLMKSPAAFAAAINADLVKIFGSVVTFATAMCGVIDARTGTLIFTGAGGPTPIIIHENWTVDEPKSTGPPLGVMEDIPYQEKTVNLKPGDSILLLSDGAVEIQNANQEWLGVDGFTQILKDLNYPQMP
jgi:serine phosphatase RsbU (regulator of sigma subunit)